MTTTPDDSDSARPVQRHISRQTGGIWTDRSHA